MAAYRVEKEIMRMRRRGLWGLLAASVSVAMLGDLPVSAAEHTLEIGEYMDGCFFVEYTGAASMEGAKMAGLCEIDTVYKDVGNLAYLEPMIGTFQGGLYGFVLKDEDLARLLEIHESCQRWLSANMPLIVKEGTPWKEAVMICAEWVADHMVYDSAALTDVQRLKYYQSAESCFANGTGVCATYATAYDSMVYYLPVGKTTGKVTYTDTDVWHLNTRYVSNQTHQWSAVWEGDGWHFYDITFYDNADGERRPEYLDMTAETFADGNHDGIITYFSPEESIFVLRQGL